MGVRRLLSLIGGLPQTSAVWRAAHDDGWTQQDELLATIVDMLGMNNQLILAVNSKKGAKLPEPVRFPRPWEKEEKTGLAREQSSTDEVRAFFGTQADDPARVVVR